MFCDLAQKSVYLYVKQLFPIELTERFNPFQSCKNKPPKPRKIMKKKKIIIIIIIIITTIIIMINK